MKHPDIHVTRKRFSVRAPHGSYVDCRMQLTEREWRAINRELRKRGYEVPPHGEMRSIDGLNRLLRHHRNPSLARLARGR